MTKYHCKIKIYNHLHDERFSMDSTTKEKTHFENIKKRISHIRRYEMKQKPYTHLQIPDIFDNKNNAKARLVAEDRISQDFLHSLLVVYDKSGLEWSQSHMGERLIQRDLPRKGALHKHSYIEIMYVISGSFTQILLGEKHRFVAGSFVITDQNCQHADFVDARDAAVLFLGLSSDYMDRLLKSYDKKDELQRFLFHALRRQKREESVLHLVPTHTSPDLQFEILRLLELILAEDLIRFVGYQKIEDGYMNRLLHLLCLGHSPIRYSSSKEGRDQTLLYEIERFIRSHLSSITLQMLEKEFHYGRNYYSQLLKKYRGLSFRDYVQELRMEQACHYLSETNMPIRQIALLCGYENTNFFYHLFHRTFGIHPMDYRMSSRYDSDPI